MPRASRHFLPGHVWHLPPSAGVNPVSTNAYLLITKNTNRVPEAAEPKKTQQKQAK
jgi:hypothetical protein